MHGAILILSNKIWRGFYMLLSHTQQMACGNLIRAINSAAKVIIFH